MGRAEARGLTGEMSMDVAADPMIDPLRSAYEATMAAPALSLDPNEALDLHRAINERRAQLENPELLRHIRSL